MRIKRTNLLVRFFWIAILIVIIAGISKNIWTFLHTPRWSEAILHHTIEEPQNNFELLWSISDAFSPFVRQGGVFLTAKDEELFLWGSLDEKNFESLISLDIESGQVNWQANNRRSHLGKQPSAMVSNSNYIYLGYQDGGKISGDTLKGAASLTAYAINSGEEAWSQRIGGARSITTIVATDNTVSVAGSFSSKYYLLIPESGELIEARDRVEGYIWLIQGSISYELYADGIRARNTQSETIIWESALNSLVLLPPTFTHDTILIRTEEIWGQAYAINRDTGEVLWQHKDVISNIAVSDSTAFYLTVNSQLVAVDVQTGNVLGILNLTPNKLGDISNHGFYIAASNDIVVLYMGDSQQLFAFRFLSDN